MVKDIGTSQDDSAYASLRSLSDLQIESFFDEEFDRLDESRAVKPNETFHKQSRRNESEATSKVAESNSEFRAVPIFSRLEAKKPAPAAAPAPAALASYPSTLEIHFADKMSKKTSSENEVGPKLFEPNHYVEWLAEGVTTEEDSTFTQGELSLLNQNERKNGQRMMFSNRSGKHHVPQEECTAAAVAGLSQQEVVSDCMDEAHEMELALDAGVKRRQRASSQHNKSERKRRDRINERLKMLQSLIPSSNRPDKVSILDDVIHYVQRVQLQLKVTSRMPDSNIQSFFPTGQQTKSSHSIPRGSAGSRGPERHVTHSANRDFGVGLGMEKESNKKRGAEVMTTMGYPAAFYGMSSIPGPSESYYPHFQQGCMEPWHQRQREEVCPVSNGAEFEAQLQQNVSEKKNCPKKLRVASQKIPQNDDKDNGDESLSEN